MAQPPAPHTTLTVTVGRWGWHPAEPPLGEWASSETTFPHSWLCPAISSQTLHRRKLPTKLLKAPCTSDVSFRVCRQSSPPALRPVVEWGALRGATGRARLEAGPLLEPAEALGAWDTAAWGCGVPEGLRCSHRRGGPQPSFLSHQQLPRLPQGPASPAPRGLRSRASRPAGPSCGKLGAAAGQGKTGRVGGLNQSPSFWGPAPRSPSSHPDGGGRSRPASHRFLEA